VDAQLTEPGSLLINHQHIHVFILCCGIEVGISHRPLCHGRCVLHCKHRLTHSMLVNGRAWFA
jgi:hypothetical protein